MSDVASLGPCEQLKAYHKAAYSLIDEAMLLDQQGASLL
jgi:hypothetical protein